MDQDQCSWAKEYATCFMAEMVKRFPPTDKDNKESANDTTKKSVMLGAGVSVYVHALFIHPYYRGNLIKNVSEKEYKMR